MSLLLYCRSELHELLWHRLLCLFEDVDEGSGKALLILCEERNGKTILTGTASSKLWLAAYPRMSNSFAPTFQCDARSLPQSMGTSR